MKKLAFSLLAIGFGFALVLISALSVSKRQVEANFGPDEQSASSQEINELKTLVGLSENNTLLLLPNNPVYSLLRALERIELVNTKEPDKPDLLLKRALHRLETSVLLLADQQTQAAVVAATKAHGYLAMIWDLQPEVVADDQWCQAHKASQLQLQVFTKLQPLLEGQAHTSLQQLIEQAKMLEIDFGLACGQAAPPSQPTETPEEQSQIKKIDRPAELGI